MGVVPNPTASKQSSRLASTTIFSREPSFGTREPSVYGTAEALSLKTCNTEVAQTEMNLKAAAEVLTDDLRLGEGQTNLMVYPAGKDDKSSDSSKKKKKVAPTKRGS